MSALYDPRLQPERTELAWRRTSLALAVGSLVAMRVLPEVLGHIAWCIPGIAGVVAAGGLWLGSRRRYGRVNAAVMPLDAEAGDLPDGMLPLAAASIVALAGVLSIATVLVVALTL